MENEKRLIDADAWESFLKERQDFLDGKVYDPYYDGYEDASAGVDDWMNAQPRVDAVEVVRGHWVIKGGHRKMDLFCSVCNRRASNFVGGYEDWWDLWMPKYCPHCGAKMDGDGNGNL